MKRAIIFRAWLKNADVPGSNERMVYSGELAGKDDVAQNKWFWGNYYSWTSEKFLMQFTGFKDKNGHGIYESDVFEGPFYDRPYSKARKFIKLSGIVSVDSEGHCTPWPAGFNFKYPVLPSWEECEIIGNVHEGVKK